MTSKGTSVESELGVVDGALIEEIGILHPTTNLLCDPRQITSPL